MSWSRVNSSKTSLQFCAIELVGAEKNLLECLTAELSCAKVSVFFLFVLFLLLMRDLTKSKA